MKPRLKAFYKMAKKDEAFCAAMNDSSGNWVPGFFSGELERVLFAGMYQGYLLKKMGPQEYSLLYDSL